MRRQRRPYFPMTFDYVLGAIILVALTVLVTLDARAQTAPEHLVRFGAATVTGTSSVTPVLTWCTETAAPPAGTVPITCGNVKPAASAHGSMFRYRRVWRCTSMSPSIILPKAVS